MKICFCLFDSQFVYWMSVYYIYCCYSVAQSCPSPSPWVCPGSCPLDWWCIEPSHPLMPSSPSGLSLCQHQRLFQRVDCSYQVTKILELQLQHQPSNDYPGLISLKIDWFDPLSVQGTLKTFLQHHSSKAPILQQSAFFMVQLSQLYLTTGKTITLTMWTLVGKVMSLPFNTLSSFVIAFLPSSCLLISWLQSPSALILEPKNRKSVLLPPFPHLFAMKWCGQMPWSYFFKY